MKDCQNHHKTSKCPLTLPAVLMIGLLWSFGNCVIASGNTLRLDNDSNSRVEVGNAITSNDATTLFLWTWPDMGDANSGNKCALNFYSLELKPGLASLQPQSIANNVCTSNPGLGGLLDDGDGLIIARDQMQRWRAGDQVDNATFAKLDATAKLGLNSDKAGSQFFSLSASGDVVIAAPALDQNNLSGVSLVLTRLQSNGKKVWQVKIENLGSTFTIEQLWADNNGGALLYLTSHSASSLVPVSEPQLRYVSASGQISTIKLVEVPEPLDMASLTAGSQEDLQKLFAQQKNSKPEKIKRLAARPGNSGGFDVIFQRMDGKEGRSGHFLQHIGADGSLQSDIALGSPIEDYGLDNWVDFYLDGNQLVLLSTVMATQEGVSSRRKKWPQNVVSWIDIESGTPISRLIPLNQRYLQAAMNAGDEGQQHLEGQPGGEALMLTTLAGRPLAISRGRIQGKFTLRINEATEDLVVFTETMDEQTQSQAKQQARQQRNADREAQQQHINEELAKSVGMSPEAFAALSNQERQEMMVRHGDLEVIQSLSQEYSQQVQQAAAAAAPANSAQKMDAMAEMQNRILNDPNMTPEMKAQMTAIMAQSGATSSAQLPQPPNETTDNSAGATSSDAIDPEKTLALDAGMRGFVEYQNEQGQPLTLLIVNQQNQQTLFKKEYADGNIYEYIDFSRFQLPLNQLSVTYLNQDGKVLKQLTPASTR